MKRYTVLNKRTELTYGIYRDRKEAQAEAKTRNGYFGKKPGHHAGFTVIEVKNVGKEGA